MFDIKKTLVKALVSATLAVSITAMGAVSASAAAPIKLEQENSESSISFSSGGLDATLEFETEDGHIYTIEVITDGTAFSSGLDTLEAAVYRDGEFLFTVNFLELYRAIAGIDGDGTSDEDFEDIIDGYKNETSQSGGFSSAGLYDLG